MFIFKGYLEFGQHWMVSTCAICLGPDDDKKKKNSRRNNNVKPSENAIWSRVAKSRRVQEKQLRSCSYV